MKKVCLTLLCGTLAFGVLGSFRTNTAHALPEFKKEFDKKYVGDGSTDAQKAIGAAVKAAKCNVCHDPKKDEKGMESKKNRNAYGDALHKFVGKKDKKNVEKIVEALGKAEAEKAPDGKTFGEHLKAGKLPVETK